MNATVNNLVNEEFRDLDSFPGYQVSNFGRVKSLKHKEELIMTPYADKDGYLRLGLRAEGKQKYLFVHQLVAMAFLGHVPCGMKKVINHLDEIKQHNFSDNFEITTMRGNVSHSMKHPPKGAFFHNYSKRWRAKICIEGKVRWLGSYKTEEEAKAAYQKALAEAA